MTHAPSGHDGPYDAPVESPSREVPAEWIDYNGHVNVAYYTMAIDWGADHLFDDHLGLGEAHAKVNGQGPMVVQLHVHYLGEILKGERFTVRGLLLDWDQKRIHWCAQICVDGQVRCVAEQMTVNVDLTARRTVPYPDWAQARLARMLEDHADIPRPAQIGRGLEIRRS
ncbi:thioesterase family protein [Pontivivens insulae]|uniref:L-carnitine dehydrogenase n=1 Tax=Pontivivens insulae TaxID=1639689 RepID=A0A2R8ADT4_9RHOB|nr:thioesterase family protein [Pontivivens insulae]RED14154.1 acyl-CoA thioester hydrolase [Pontivivens insulae]SPF30230.1 L-carnitine dehydrogenase [Pontivivens insulae]